MHAIAVRNCSKAVVVKAEGKTNHPAVRRSKLCDRPRLREVTDPQSAKTVAFLSSADCIEQRLYIYNERTASQFCFHLEAGEFLQGGTSRE